MKNIFGINPNFGKAFAKVIKKIALAANLEATKAQVKFGGFVGVIDNMEVSGKRMTFEKDTVLDLKGRTISAAPGFDDVTVLHIINGAKLTIKNGTVDASSGELQCIIVTDGELIIESGTYIGGLESSCIYANSDSAKVTINGGYFKCASPWNEKYYVINAKNGTKPVITVNGGQFENYDPATGDDADGDNFLAEGKTSVKEGDVYIVK